MAPGAQRAIAQRNIAARPAGDAPTIPRHNEWAGRKREIDARWANTPTKQEAQGIGVMSA